MNKYLSVIASLVVCGSLGAAERGITNTSASPHVTMRSVGMTDVRWTAGFWADRFELCRKVVAPGLWEDLQLPNNGASYRNFLIAAGIERGRSGTTWWGDGDFYKWLETIAHLYATTRDPALDKRMDELIAVIAKAQAADGYISTPIQIGGLPRWSNLNHHELYNMGHLITAACIHFRASGKDNFLKIAVHNADYLYKVFQPRPKELAHFCFDPSQIMGLVELYRTTGEKRYLELAGIFVDMRGSQPGGSDQNQTRVRLRQETDAVGHAVTGPYLWAGTADVYAETGEKELWDALDRIWRVVTQRKMSVTGAIGAVNRGASLRGDPTHEAFGLAYELPNRIAYNETCANIAHALWNWRMLAATGEARYADVMELVLYNSMLSGMGLDGRSFFYANPLLRLADTQPMLHNESLQRWVNTTTPGASRSWCCPPNVSRMLASMHEYAYGLSPGTVWVNLYGANTLQAILPGGGRVELRQASNYPWEGGVKIRIDAAAAEPMGIRVRIPAWAERASISVNGRAAETALQPGTYAEVRRRWKAGDSLELDLPMPPRLVAANPVVESARNQVAVMRGPIVYCLESNDLPPGVNFHDVVIPSGIRLLPRYDAGLLGGVVVLEGSALAAPEANWTGTLYQTWKPAMRMEFPLRLIPYYAWANRGASYMTVWLPRAL
jgi:hypothetical protein